MQCLAIRSHFGSSPFLYAVDLAQTTRNMFAATKRSRVTAVMIGVEAHADALGKWFTLRGHRDIAAMLAPTLDSGMRQWRRSMPDADEMNSYVDLVNIYIAKSLTLMFGQVELATALLEMHGQSSCFPC